LASAQIPLKEFGGAHATLGRIDNWLQGPFKRYYDQDPLETFADYDAKYYALSGQLAEAENRTADALAFYQHLTANPYFRREYSGYVKETRALWIQLGGTDSGWAALSAVALPSRGAPTGYQGVAFLPWIALDYTMPTLSLPGLDSNRWTNSNFEGRFTMLYLWASWCGPCWSSLPAIQSVYDRTRNRHDVQAITLSVDEDPQKLAAFMKEKGYTFPVMVGSSYAKKLLPRMILGQIWIVDGTGAIRLQRTENHLGAAEQALADEVLYKLNNLSAFAIGK